MIKRKMNDKEYQYDLKAVFIPSETHTEIKKMSATESMTMGEVIGTLLKEYKKK